MTGGEDVADQLVDLNAYGKALNRAEKEDQVASLTLEAMSVLLELPYATFVVMRSDDPVVADSTHPSLRSGDAAGELARRALSTDETVLVTGSETNLPDGPDVTAAAAVPVLLGEEPIAVLITRGTSGEDLDEVTLRPLEILASHVATALGNIRSREQLERAQRGLEARAELLDLYSQLFRHHLRNDLNIVAGYAEMLEEGVDGEAATHLATIRETVAGSIDLVERASSLHSEIEDVDGLAPRSLREAVASSVETATDRHDDLTVSFGDDDLDYEVYAGRGLETVFDNLLENAAIHNAGPVTVSIDVESPDPSRVVAVVADDGDGIDRSVRESLFVLGAKDPESGGIGLGLGFVRHLVESYGGNVAVGDSASGGAEYRITLERV